MAPWHSWEEWFLVYLQLTSNGSAHKEAALQQLLVWRLRGPVSLAIELTIDLLDAALLDHVHASRGSKRHASRSQVEHHRLLQQSEEQLKSCMGMAVMRFVSGFTDRQQKFAGVRSMTAIAAECGVPEEVVELRHELAHAHTPSLAALRAGLHQTILLIMKMYWHPQAWRLARLANFPVKAARRPDDQALTKRLAKDRVSFLVGLVRLSLAGSNNASIVPNHQSTTLERFLQGGNTAATLRFSAPPTWSLFAGTPASTRMPLAAAGPLAVLVAAVAAGNDESVREELLSSLSDMKLPSQEFLIHVGASSCVYAGTARQAIQQGLAQGSWSDAVHVLLACASVTGGVPEIPAKVLQDMLSYRRHSKSGEVKARLDDASTDMASVLDITRRDRLKKRRSVGGQFAESTAKRMRTSDAASDTPTDADMTLLSRPGFSVEGAAELMSLLFSFVGDAGVAGAASQTLGGVHVLGRLLGCPLENKEEAPTLSEILELLPDNLLTMSLLDDYLLPLIHPTSISDLGYRPFAGLLVTALLSRSCPNVTVQLVHSSLLRIFQLLVSRDSDEVSTELLEPNSTFSADGVPPRTVALLSHASRKLWDGDAPRRRVSLRARPRKTRIEQWTRATGLDSELPYLGCCSTEDDSVSEDASNIVEADLTIVRNSLAWLQFLAGAEPSGLDLRRFYLDVLVPAHAALAAGQTDSSVSHRWKLEQLAADLAADADLVATRVRVILLDAFPPLQGTIFQAVTALADKLGQSRLSLDEGPEDVLPSSALGASSSRRQLDLLLDLIALMDSIDEDKRTAANLLFEQSIAATNHLALWGTEWPSDSESSCQPTTDGVLAIDIADAPTNLAALPSPVSADELINAEKGVDHAATTNGEIPAAELAVPGFPNGSSGHVDTHVVSPGLKTAHVNNVVVKTNEKVENEVKGCDSRRESTTSNGAEEPVSSDTLLTLLQRNVQGRTNLQGGKDVSTGIGDVDDSSMTLENAAGSTEIGYSSVDVSLLSDKRTPDSPIGGCSSVLSKSSEDTHVVDEHQDEETTIEESLEPLGHGDESQNRGSGWSIGQLVHDFIARTAEKIAPSNDEERSTPTSQDVKDDLASSHNNIIENGTVNMDDNAIISVSSPVDEPSSDVFEVGSDHALSTSWQEAQEGSCCNSVIEDDSPVSEHSLNTSGNRIEDNITSVSASVASDSSNAGDTGSPQYPRSLRLGDLKRLWQSLAQEDASAALAEEHRQQVYGHLVHRQSTRSDPSQTGHILMCDAGSVPWTAAGTVLRRLSQVTTDTDQHGQPYTPADISLVVSILPTMPVPPVIQHGSVTE